MIEYTVMIQIMGEGVGCTEGRRVDIPPGREGSSRFVFCTAVSSHPTGRLLGGRGDGLHEEEARAVAETACGGGVASADGGRR